MRTLLLTTFCLFLYHLSFGVNPIIPSENEATLSNIDLIAKNYSSKDILQLNARKYKKATQTRLSLKDRVCLHISKVEIARAIKQGKSEEEIQRLVAATDDNSQLWLAFLLGFVLGLMGVLVCYLVDDFKAHTKYAWIGLGSRVALVLLFYVVYFVLILGIYQIF